MVVAHNVRFPPIPTISASGSNRPIANIKDAMHLRVMKGTSVALGAALAVALPQVLSSAARPTSITVEQSRRVKVADGEMALFVSGSGTPAIIFEAGTGGDHRTWKDVQPTLGKLTRTVSYDRLGLGSSSASKRFRSASNYVEELREGLRNAGITPPYVLVGHSLGGALVRLYASRYPSEVVGLVLVDPAMEGFFRRAAVEAPKAYLDQMEEEAAAADASGKEALKREFLAFETSMQQLRQAEFPKGKKVVILSAAEIQIREPLRVIRLDENARWAKKVGATHIYVNSGHSIHREHPDAVIKAVTQVLASARQK